VVLISWAGFFATAFIGELTVGERHRPPCYSTFNVFVRTVLFWHITWSVNHVTHLWGYRNYEIDASGRNKLIIGYFRRRGLA
jgi:fatty-acid desaturase